MVFLRNIIVDTLHKGDTEDDKKKKKNLSIVWIDYQKAFDSVPHS
jgi:hypothetical protein